MGGRYLDVPTGISPHSIRSFFPVCIRTKIFSTRFWCTSCHKCFEHQLCYYCARCNLYMDVTCAWMPRVMYDLNKQYIQHFSHQHEMALLEKFQEEEVVCFACQSQCRMGTPTYACTRCKYFLHKRCAECPLEISSFNNLHNHNLSLCIDHEKYVTCQSCARKSCCFVFKCTICNWCFCIDCCLLPKQLLHNDYYYLDSHHDHRPDLTLSRSTNASTKLTCGVCHVNFRSSSAHFKCVESCGFVVDVECALVPPIRRNDQGHFQHFNDPHAMTLLQMDDGDHENCFACDSPCKSCLAYSCLECKSFLHKSCAELPLKIHYPVHKHPFLTLIHYKELCSQISVCSLCKRDDVSGFLFRCFGETCPFRLCGRCVLRRYSIVSYEILHKDHSLCLVDVPTNLDCNAYEGYCQLPVTSSELCIREYSMFRCADCNFNVHFLCGPLPCTIKYEYHIHPLVLVDSIDEDDSDKYYCDICEKERDLRIYAYYCEECKYTAHVHCLKSQIITLLRRDLTEVKLRTVKIKPKNEKNKASTDENNVEYLRDIVNKLPEDEMKILWRNFEFDWDEQHQHFRKLARFTPQYFEDFVDFLNRLYRSRRLKIKPSLLDSQVAVVEGYTIPNSNTFPRVLTTATS